MVSACFTRLMPNHKCWLCASVTGHTLVGDPTVAGVETKLPIPPESNFFFCAYECSSCHAISIGMINVRQSTLIRVGGLHNYLDTLTGDQFTWKPSVGETLDYPDVPPHIAESATEAYECASLRHNRAAVMLARAVIEATAKAQNITSGNLYSKIESLAAQNYIRAHIKDAAHSVRVLGNEMAHGDFVNPISDEDTRLVIDLMGEILNEVFQSPAKIQRAQQAAQALGQPPGTGGQA